MILTTSIKKLCLGITRIVGSTLYIAGSDEYNEIRKNLIKCLKYEIINTAFEGIEFNKILVSLFGKFILVFLKDTWYVSVKVSKWMICVLKKIYDYLFNGMFSGYLVDRGMIKRVEKALNRVIDDYIPCYIDGFDIIDAEIFI